MMKEKEICCFSVQYKDKSVGADLEISFYWLFIFLYAIGSSKQIYQSIGCHREQVSHREWKCFLQFSFRAKTLC